MRAQEAVYLASDKVAPHSAAGRRLRARSATAGPALRFYHDNSRLREGSHPDEGAARAAAGGDGRRVVSRAAVHVRDSGGVCGRLPRPHAAALRPAGARHIGQRDAGGDRRAALPGAAGAARQGVRPGGAAAAPAPRPRAAGRRRRGALALHRRQLRGHHQPPHAGRRGAAGHARGDRAAGGRGQGQQRLPAAAPAGRGDAHGAARQLPAERRRARQGAARGGEAARGRRQLHHGHPAGAAGAVRRARRGAGRRVRGARGPRQAPRDAGLLVRGALQRRGRRALAALLRDARAHRARGHARHRRPGAGPARAALPRVQRARRRRPLPLRHDARLRALRGLLHARGHHRARRRASGHALLRPRLTSITRS